MKAIMASILIFSSFSAFSYSFNLPENTCYKNRSCVLTLGKKIYTKRGTEILYKQEALLQAGRAKIEFTINDYKNSNSAYILGSKFIDDGKLVIQGQQSSPTRLKLIGVMQEPTNTENILFDCGELLLDVL